MRTYPESAQRVQRIIQSLEDHGQSITTVDLCEVDAIQLVHASDYIQFLQSIPPDCEDKAPYAFAFPRSRNRPSSFEGLLGYYFFDPATPLTPTSFEAAHGAVSVALSTVEQVMTQHSPAFGLCRPPGHHASRAHGGGYCLFNNIAVAAARAVEQGQRVSILDLDFHHGNGTQDLFYNTSQVQYLSLHADPRVSYPFFWGSKDEQGEGDGLGFTHNYPLDPLVTGEKYRNILNTALLELERNDPDLILVSMGFDTYIEDPIAGMQLREDDYFHIGSRLSEYSSIGFVLEGGYHLDTLGSNFIQLFEGMGI